MQYHGATNTQVDAFNPGAWAVTRNCSNNQVPPCPEWQLAPTPTELSIIYVSLSRTSSFTVVAAVGLAGNGASGRPAESTPTPTEELPFDSNPNTPSIVIEAAFKSRSEWLARITLPPDLRSLPHELNQSVGGYDASPRLADTLGPAGATPWVTVADAIIEGTVREIAALATGHMEVRVDVDRWVASRDKATPLATSILVRQRTKIVPVDYDESKLETALELVEGAAPILPGDRVVLLLAKIDGAWVQLRWTATWRVDGDTVRADIGVAEEQRAPGSEPGDGDPAARQWIDKYQDMPLEALIGELGGVAAAQGWAVAPQ